MKYDAEVAAAISRVNPSIDPLLVHAIIQKESSHGAKLVTPESGGRYSYGPMMVLDTTASSMYGVADPSSLARDPAAGIYYGVRYLDSRMRANPGDVPAAIAAYNSGTAHRTGTGFTNQAYVNAVWGFWNQYKLTAPVATGAAVVLAALVGTWLFLRGRRRR